MKILGISGNLMYLQTPCRNIPKSKVHFPRKINTLIFLGLEPCNSGLGVGVALWVLNNGDNFWYRYTDPMNGPEATAWIQHIIDVSLAAWPFNNNGFGYNVVAKATYLDKLTPTQFSAYQAAH